MTLEEMRSEMEAYRTAVDEQAEAFRDSYYALECLYALYRRFNTDERALAHQVLSEWVVSDDEKLRFDALALIDDFKITEAANALLELERRLTTNNDPGAPYEIQKVRRILGDIAGR